MLEPDEISLFVERLEAVGAQYMITGATAAIVYGQPRVTNDIDVVLALGEEHVSMLLVAFPASEFYPAGVGHPRGAVPQPPRSFQRYPSRDGLQS